MEWLPTLVFLSGEFHGQKSLVGYSPWGHKELDVIERLTQTKISKLISALFDHKLLCFSSILHTFDIMLTLKNYVCSYIKILL